MSRRLELRPFVPADILDAVAYLDLHAAGSGSRFAAALAETLDWLADHAEAGSPKSFADPRLTDFRSWPVRTFEAHLIFYRVQTDRLEVFAIVRGTRDVPPLLRVRV